MTNFAIYSPDDFSLNFYDRETVPTEGDVFEGLTVIGVYTDINAARPAWSTYAAIIQKVNIVDAIAPTSMMRWFYGFSNLTSLNLSNLDTSNVTSMYGTFYGCVGLTNIDLSNFNTANVTNMDSMFYGCTGLTSIDLSSFNTSNVVNMSSMFRQCTGLTSIDLSNFDTSSVKSMNAMFSNCTGLTTLDLSYFDMSSITNVKAMFQNCTNLTTIYVRSSWSVLSTSTFSGCTSLVGGNGTVYNSANVTSVYAVIDTAETPGYFTYKPIDPLELSYLIQGQYLKDTADAIRSKTGSTELIKPINFSSAISEIPTQLLPDGYTQLDYIESTGTQYIDTGFIGNQDTRVVADVVIPAARSGACFLFGARQTSSSGRFSAYAGSTYFGFGYNTAANNTTITIDTSERYTVDYNKNTFTVGGESTTVTASTFSTSYPMYLFCENQVGSPTQYVSCKLYSCQVYDNGTLVRDYIPCMNAGGVLGLYDTVNRVFYENSGTGVFTNSVIDTASATATAADIASGKTAYAKGIKLTGTGSMVQSGTTKCVWVSSYTYGLQFTGLTAAPKMLIAYSSSLGSMIWYYPATGVTNAKKGAPAGNSWSVATSSFSSDTFTVEVGDFTSENKEFEYYLVP